jgi:hypothetical protein
MLVSMDPKLWQRLKPLLDGALKEPEGARAGYVADCTDDPMLRDELKHLLESSQTGELPANSEILAPRSNSFTAGETLLGRFHIVRLVGRGGMGEVYEAEDLELGRIALKTIRHSVAARAGMLARFKQEIQLARKVSGPNVCRIYELFTVPETDGRSATAFLTMEFLDGMVLTERLRRGRMDWDRARSFALDMCAGLAAIHEAGVLHRDFKSSNIMLARRNGVERAVLTDFGLAMPLDEAAGGSGEPQAGSSRHVIAGTPEYMAPEQFEGSELTGAADIYALGIVMYEMVTGQHPYAAHTPLAAAVRRAKTPDLTKAPHGWREIIFRCLQYDPAKRYKSAGEVAAALRRTANPLAQATHDAAGTLRRSKVAVAAVLIAAAGLVGWEILQRVRMHRPPAEAVRWYGKGVAALREATYVKAIAALQSAVELDPKYAMAHARLAEAWSELDFTGQADHEMLLASSESHQQRISGDDQKYLAASQATLTRDYAGAVRDYRELLDEKRDEDRPAGLVDLGRAQEKAGNMSGALTSYELAAKLAPDEPAAFVHIGILESRQQHEAQANTAFAQAEKLYRAETNLEGLAEIEYQQGYLANEQQDPATAKPHLETALASAKQIPSPQLEIRTLTQLSSAASLAGNSKEAADDANAAIELANSNQLESWAADGMVRLADSYLASGDPAATAKAKGILQQALAIAKQSEQRRVEARANIDMANLSKDDPDAAAMYAQQALDYYKPNGFSEGTNGAYTLLARAQRDKDELVPALKLSEELVAEAQRSGSAGQVALARNLQGTILLRQEQYPAALVILNSALSGSSAVVRPYLENNYAQALWRVGDYSGAESVLQKDPSKATEQQAAEIRVEMELSQKHYAKAAAMADAAMSGMSAEDRPVELVIMKARAESYIGKEQDADKELEALQARIPAKGLTRAEWQLAAGEIAMAGNQPSVAHENGQKALNYYRSLNAVESEIRAAALVTRAAQMSGVAKDGTDAANFGLDILHQLHDSWSPTQYQAFLSRPDIKDAAQQLQAGASAR